MCCCSSNIGSNGFPVQIPRHPLYQQGNPQEKEKKPARKLDNYGLFGVMVLDDMLLQEAEDFVLVFLVVDEEAIGMSRSF